MLRYHPKYAETDPTNPRAWGTCDRCGRVWNLDRLAWQYEYRGTTSLQNIRVLCCPTCLDEPNLQFTPNVLPPDPPPLYNARPEPYTIDETDWLTTQDGDIIETQAGDDLTPSLPNPASDAVAGENSIVQEGAVTITTEDGSEIVTESGEGNTLNIDPNPGTITNTDG